MYNCILVSKSLDINHCILLASTGVKEYTWSSKFAYEFQCNHFL